MTLSIILLNLLYYFTGWDFFTMAGLAKMMFQLVFLPVGVFILCIRWLLRHTGQSPFLEILAHCIIIGFLTGLPVGGYFFVFERYMAPEHRTALMEQSIEGLRENMSQVNDLKLKQNFTDEIYVREQQIKEFREHPPGFRTYLEKSLVQFLFLALLFGSIFGFIFSKMVVSTKT